LTNKSSAEKPLAAKEFGAAPSGEGLRCVGVFDPLVVARVRVAPVVDEAGLVVQDVVLAEETRLFVGIALGVDVLESGSQRLADGQRSGALGRDQDEFAGLPLSFDAAQFVGFRVEFRQRAAEEMVGHARSLVRGNETARCLTIDSMLPRRTRSRKEVTPAGCGPLGQ